VLSRTDANVSDENAIGSLKWLVRAAAEDMTSGITNLRSRDSKDVEMGFSSHCHP